MNPWRVAGGGLAATFIGNGLGWFAYTPLIPVLIAAGWFSPAEASHVAAGYLVGALDAEVGLAAAALHLRASCDSP